MKYTVVRALPVQPPVEKIVLEVSPEELTLIHATLGCTNGGITAARARAGRYTMSSAINSSVSANIFEAVDSVLRELGLFR